MATIEERYAAWQAQKQVLQGISTEILVAELGQRCEQGMDGYIAAKIWHIDDIRTELWNLGFDPSDTNVRKVLLHSRLGRDLGEPDDLDRELIEDAIRGTPDLELCHDSDDSAGN